MGTAADGGEFYSEFILKKFKSKYLMKVFVCSEGEKSGRRDEERQKELMKVFKWTEENLLHSVYIHDEPLT